MRWKSRKKIGRGKVVSGGCRARRTTSGSEYTSREHREVRQGSHLGRPGPDEPRTKLVLPGTMRHGRSPKRCKAPTCFWACPPAARLLILAIADQPLIFEGSEIAYDVVLASRPEAIVGSVARTAWSAGRRGSRMISYCEQLERRVGKAHEVMHLMIHKAKDCTRLVFTEKRAGRGKSECGDRHDRLMSDDDRPISSLDRLPGNRDRLQSPSGDQTTSSSGWVSVAFFQTQEWTTCPGSSAGSKPAAATALATLASSRVPWPSGNT